MKTAVVLACLAAFAIACTSAVDLPDIIDDNMVLQRAPAKAVLWGWSTPGENVNATIVGHSQYWYGETNADGIWNITLDAFEKGGPYILEIKDHKSSRSLKNVMFGDVFLCGGQSNMVFSVSAAFNATEELVSADQYPGIRVYTVNRVESRRPENNVTSLAKYNWGVSSKETLGGEAMEYFSAVCYFFGRELYIRDPTVPIGLVSSNWGGTKIETWSSPETLKMCANATSEIPRRTTLDHSRFAGPTGDSVLWNAMIHPILRMRFFAFLWYQGEANAGAPQAYECQFKALITMWRREFELPDAGFYFVQLAPMVTNDNSFADLRWAQAAALVLPKTGMATAIDLGDPYSPEGSVHPRNKQEVSRRLSLWAYRISYGLDVSASGPVPTAVSQRQTGLDWEMLVTFDYAEGLGFVGSEACDTCCESPRNGVELQLEDGTWTLADSADIDDDVLTATTTKGPILAIRYAWSEYPQCVLINSNLIAGPPFIISSKL